MAKVEWTKKSIESIYQISEFYKVKSPKYADRLVDKFFEKGDLLGQFPKLGRQVPEFKSPLIRELLFQNFRIIYKYEKDLIQILTIHNGLTPLSDKSIFD